LDAADVGDLGPIALAHVLLGVVDPERLHLDHRVAGLRLGLRDLPDLQHVRPAELFPQNRAHEKPSSQQAAQDGEAAGSCFLRASRRSIENGPAPPRISATRPAMYRRLTSMPGGPNCGPSAVNPMVLMALKPYRKWTVNIATSIMTISGMLTTATNAPARIARPPRISMNVDTQAVASGSGAPICSSSLANPAGPRLSLAHP